MKIKPKKTTKRFQKEKQLAEFNQRRGRNRSKAHNRFFLDQDTMGEARWNAAIAYSMAKREGKKITGVFQHVWHCPCACISTTPVGETNVN